MIFFTALNDLWDFCAQFGWTFLQNQLNKLSEFGPVTPGDIIIHYLFIFIMLQSAVSYRRFHNVFKTAALRKIKNISIMARNAYRILFFSFIEVFSFTSSCTGKQLCLHILLVIIIWFVYIHIYMHTGCILRIDLLDRQLSNLKYEKTQREKSTKVCKKPLRFIMEFSSYSTLLLSLIYALTDTHT